MKLFKKAGLVFSIALVLASALTSFIPQKSYAQTPEQIQAEVNRELLVNTRLCLEKDSTLDLSDDEYDANNDILSNFEVNGGENSYGGNGNEVHVVGLLVDDDDGVMSCTQVIQRGINVLEGSGTISASTPASVGAWLMRRLTGQNLNTTNNRPFEPDQAAMEQQLAALIGELNAEAARYESTTRPVANELLRLRALPLARQCYTISGQAGQGQVGDNGFEVANGFFYPKDGRQEIVGVYNDNNGLTLAPYLNTSRQDRLARSRKVYVGDIQLGWQIGGNLLGTAGTEFGELGGEFEFGSNFYPIGRDIPQTSGLSAGIVDCLFIRDNANAIFAGLAIQDDGSITMADGSPLTGALAAAAEPPEASAGNDEPSCESEGGEGSWLLCPLLRGMDTGIATLDREIGQLLRVNGEYFNDPALRNAAVRVRNIAYILIIPILLFMVISTALGFGFVDAYTIKRALPRLLLAIIFATLSFDIVRIMVVATNGIGAGVAGIITQPFSPEGFNGMGLANIFNSGGAASDGLILTSALVIGTASIAFLSLGVILSLLFVAFMGLLIGFVLLSFRQFLIIALAVLAPMAILSWIFPGNDKLWKLWWGTFTKLLLLYPLVMILLSSGRVFAVLMDNVGETSISNTFIKLLAYVGPFFFIPAAFKFAGGIFGNIAGIANDRGRGLFDRQRKYRGRKMSENWGKTRNYSRLSDRNKFTRGLNTALGAGSHPISDLRKGREGIRAGRQTGRALQGADNLKNDATFQAHQNDDNFLIALADEGLAREKLKKDQEDYDKAIAAGDLDGARKAQASMDARRKGLAAAERVQSRKSSATRLAAINALAKTGYQLSAGEEGYKELQNMVESVVGSDPGARAAAMDEAQYHLKNAQRFDLAGINHGAGYSLDAGLNKTGLYQLANGKTDSIKAWGARYESPDPNDPGKELDQHEWLGAAVQYRELEAMKPNATGANRDEIVRQMQVLESRGVQKIMSEAYVDPVTQSQRMVVERIPFDAARAASDPTYRAGFTAAQQAQGYREQTRGETIREASQRQARSYERIDPNRL